MRPRRIRRGWPAVGPRIAPGASPFNEAPANSPGMGYDAAGVGSPIRAFNEAPANSPGMARHRLRKREAEVLLQ